jgi:hypothetical protein
LSVDCRVDEVLILGGIDAENIARSNIKAKCGTLRTGVIELTEHGTRLSTKRREEHTAGSNFGRSAETTTDGHAVNGWIVECDETLGAIDLIAIKVEGDLIELERLISTKSELWIIERIKAEEMIDYCFTNGGINRVNRNIPVLHIR